MTTMTLVQGQKIKVKDRPLAEGSRGCHAHLWLMHEILMQKNALYITPCMWTFIMQSVAFITSTTRSYKAYFLHTNKSYIFREQFLLHATRQLNGLCFPISETLYCLGSSNMLSLPFLLMLANSFTPSRDTTCASKYP